MKKTIALFALLLLAGSAAFAQETPAKYKLYGFIRNYMVADTREVNAGTGDLYFYMPKDMMISESSMTDEGASADMNSGFNWRFLSFTTRLGLDVSGYKFGKMNLSGKVEADFYSLSGSTSSAVVPQLRLRQAFLKLNWDESLIHLTLGQTWHPVAMDLPHMTNLESGAPFNPFSRAPQVMVDVKADAITFTGGILYLNHYLPVGPSGKSADYFKYGLPEIYAGVTYSNESLIARAGVDVVNTRPYRTIGNEGWMKANGLMTAVSPYFFFQYTTGLFQMRAKAILAQSGEHMNLLSGYGVADFDWETGTYTYTPMQDLASWISFQYGKKLQFMGMLGYMKQLGTTKEMKTIDEMELYIGGQNERDPYLLWMNTAADTRIQQAFRATPTIAYNIGKFCVSLEYNLTAAQYGNSFDAGFYDLEEDARRNNRGLFNPEEMHWVLNHRFVCMTKFTF